MRRTATTLLSAMFGILLTGCGDTPGDVVTDDLGPRLTAQPDLRLGSVDDPVQNFSRLESVVIGPAGEIIVADQQANLIRVYAEDGQPLRTIGAPGTGPGHFAQLSRVLLRGDTLLVSDNQRIVSAFTLDGIFRRVVWGPGEFWSLFRDSPAGVRFGYFPAGPEALIGDSIAIIQPNVSFTYVPPDCTPRGGTFLVPIPVLRLGADGNIADTVHWSERRHPELFLAKGGATYYWSAPFSQQAQIGALPDGRGILIADERPGRDGTVPSIRLTALSPQRDTLWRREISVVPVAIAHEHFVAAAMRTPSKAMGECSNGNAGSAAVPTPEELAAAYQDTDDAATHLPALTGLRVGQDGSIWLRREDAAADSTTWQLLDPDGEPVGFLRLPAGQRVIAARGDVFLVNETDELDVPYLVRYRLRD